jgi:hypothetical protein
MVLEGEDVACERNDTLDEAERTNPPGRDTVTVPLVSDRPLAFEMVHSSAPSTPETRD